MTRTSYKTNANKPEYLPGELIHCDVCGPMSCFSIGGSRNFILLREINMQYVYFMRHKSEGKQKLKAFVNIVEKHHGIPAKYIRCDNGREFDN